MNGARFEEFTSISDALVEGLVRLQKAIFDVPQSGEDIRAELSLHGCIHALLAFHGNQAVGFKVGYAQSTSTFYSWIGGVHPEFRCRGIAKELMSRQHDWCRAQKFGKVRTHSDERFTEMMILNLRQGFRIIGTMQAEAGRTKVIFEKLL